MYIHISGWHTICFGPFIPLTIIRWRRWPAGPRWLRWWWRCTHAFPPPASLWIHCCAIMARKAAVRSIFPNHGRMTSITAFTVSCPRHTTPRFYSSRTSACGFMISCCVSSIAARKTLLQLFWLYSRSDACRTVQAVPDLFVLP